MNTETALRRTARVPADEVQARIDAHPKNPNRTIRLVRFAGNNRLPSDFECLACGREWSASTSSMLRHGTCSSCSGQSGYSIEAVRARIFEVHGSSVELLEYAGPTDGGVSAFRCDKGHEWSALARHVMKGRGCRACYHSSLSLAEDEVRTRIAEVHGSSVTMTFYSGSSTDKASEFRCDQGHTWSTTAESVFRQGTGCSRCADCAVRMSESEVAARVAARHGDRVRLTRYAGTARDNTSEFTCGDGHHWHTSADNVIHQGNACRKCADLAQLLPEQEVAARVAARHGDRVRIVHYAGTTNDKTSEFACDQGHTWNTTAGKVYGVGHGCKVCYWASLRKPRAS